MLEFALLEFTIAHYSNYITSSFFFLAGFDTVANAISFLCYNLACNPNIQDKLYQEIVEVLGDKVRIIIIMTEIEIPTNQLSPHRTQSHELIFNI